MILKTVFFLRKYLIVFVNVLTCMYFNAQFSRQTIHENEKCTQDISRLLEICQTEFCSSVAIIIPLQRSCEGI